MQTKAVVFDFDGTLSNVREGDGTWWEIWNYLGDLDIDELYYRMFRNGEISNNEWTSLVINHFIMCKLTKNQIEEISNKISLVAHTHETFETLKENGIKIFILSGGIKPMIEKVLKREKIDKYIDEFIAYEFEFDENGLLMSFKKPEEIIEPKHEYVEIIKQRYDLKPEEILYVGNDKNDESVHESGVHTLCINPRFTDISNKTIWHSAIKQCHDLREILQFVSFQIKQKD